MILNDHILEEIINKNLQKNGLNYELLYKYRRISRQYATC